MNVTKNELCAITCTEWNLDVFFVVKFTLNTLYSQHGRSKAARLCFLDFIIRFPTLCYPVKRKQANFLTPLMSGEHCRFLGILALISIKCSVSKRDRRFLGRVSFQFFLQWWHPFKPPLLKYIDAP